MNQDKIALQEYLATPTRIIKRDDFAKDFIFGSAGAAYQFEGAAQEDGRGPSIWDAWTINQPSNIADHSNGNVAIDHYHKYKDDVKLMKRTGLAAYRFSISWPRILPGGRLSGGINQEGINFYNNLIDTLLAEGIEPYVTLFHWDLPLVLQQEYGGFLSENIVKDYCEYVELCFWEFGDRVKHWITFNEPYPFCVYGYVTGTFPPGRGSSSTDNNGAICRQKGSGVPRACVEGNPGTEPYLAGHHLLLAHAYAVDLYRREFQNGTEFILKLQPYQGGNIGITEVSHFFEPLNDTQDDRNAASRALDFMLGWFLAPLATGDYPQSMRNAAGDRLPKFTQEQAKLIKDSYDFLGLNYYTTYYATYTPRPSDQPPSFSTDQELTTSTERNNVAIGPTVGSDWLAIVPRGIYNLLVYVKEKYNVRLIYITENGMNEVNDTNLTISESRKDQIRIKYHQDHLHFLKLAIKNGVNVKAYFIWSFADNFEWADGFTLRFGIFYTSFRDGRLTRYPKSSAIWWTRFLNNKLRLNQQHEDDTDSLKKPKSRNI
ncbi:Beta-glucosidase, lactase phlorizinhydrolase [Handroanthus impetiginosus]|uniref:Beta-glucosidase, lactase phlorizinhydrolase n=1 Tax=Handroanthus impetiginosus TaxID=429701 RepID=A0A2G9HNU4_9LAMI|nr:Beta-glucosidase, lactase phlorizinhydrolase [Handroanthus impetiginosus]